VPFKIPSLTGSNPLPNAPAPVLDRERRPTVDNSGLINATGALGKIDAPLLPQSLADNSGLQAIGKAVQQGGGIVQALAIKRQEAETDVQVAKADSAMLQARTEFEQWKTDTNADPSTWEKEWGSRLTSLKDTLFQDDKLTGGAREQIGLRAVRFEGQSMSDVALGATKETFSQAKSAFLAVMDNATETQDKTRFESALETAKGRGYLHPHEIEAVKQHFAKVGEQKQKEAKADADQARLTVNLADIQTDPIAWKEKNKDASAWKDNPVLYSRLANAADERIHDGQREFIDNVQDAMAKGDITTPSQIDAWESPFKRPELVEKLKDGLAQRDTFEQRQEREVNGPRNAVALRIEAKKYDPTADKDGLQYFTLRQQVYQQVPEGLRASVLDTLEAKYSGKQIPVKSETKDYVRKTLDTVFDSKQGAVPWEKSEPVLSSKGKPVIDDNGNPKTKNVEDLSEKRRAIDAQAVIETKMGQWLQENPSASPAEVKTKLNSLLPEGTRGGVLNSMGGGKLKSASIDSMNTTGRITSYGYQGDSTPDANSSAGVGAFVPSDEERKIKAGLDSRYKLKQGDIAVSPDIEKEFRAAGVKPMDNVVLKLANGDMRLVRWADRTAQDHQIAAGEVRGVNKPLRGRFDVYSPDGKDPLDGSPVVGWQKV
jgi:hypothetical protein